MKINLILIEFSSVLFLFVCFHPIQLVRKVISPLKILSLVIVQIQGISVLLKRTHVLLFDNGPGNNVKIIACNARTSLNNLNWYMYMYNVHAQVIYHKNVQLILNNLPGSMYRIFQCRDLELMFGKVSFVSGSTSLRSETTYPFSRANLCQPLPHFLKTCNCSLLYIILKVMI